MSLPRLVPVAAVAAAALAVPASASAALTLTPTGTTVVQNAGTDGIVSPGETFDFITRMSNTGGGDYQGGRGQISTANDSGVDTIITGSSAFSEKNGEVANDPSFPNADLPSGSEAPVRFRARLATNYQCGKNAAFTLNTLGGNDGVFGPFAFSVPTGAAGAIRTYETSMPGAAILNGTTSDLRVTVPSATAPDAVTDYVRGVRIHIDSLDYKYTPHWLKLQLVSPEGKVVTLFDDGDRSGFPGRDANFENNQFTNLTFVSKGDPAGIDPYTQQSQFTSGATIQANDDLSALMSGQKRSGEWKLRVTDVDPPNDARAFRRGRAASGTESVGTVGAWQLGVRAAICSATANTNTAPDAWFGGADPLVMNPGTGGTLNATGVVAKSDDPTFTPPTIASYGWDTHTPSGSAAAYTDGSGASITLPAQSRGKKTVKLQVTDSNGRSGAVERTVIFSELPVVDSVVANPDHPQANESTTLTAGISDSAGADKVAKVEWDLDDNGTFEVTTGVSTVNGQPNNVTATTAVTFTTAGTHVVRVRATNDLGAVATKALVITTANQPPVPRLAFQGYGVGVTPVLQVGQNITFDGAASSDPDGSIIKYEWNPDAGMSGTYFDSGTTKTYTTSYSAPGVYAVGIRVTDNLGLTAITELNLKVTAAPVAKPVASTTTPQVNQTVSFDGTASTDADGTVASYAWDLDGNGSFETNGAKPSRAYPNAGTVVVKLKVTDNDGATGIAVLPIAVQSPPSSGGGGGGTATPTPKPVATPTPSPGQTGPPVTIPGGGTITPIVVDTTKAAEQVASLNNANTDAGSSIQLDDFAAAIKVTAKQKAKKAYKAGVVVGISATDKSKFTLKAMITKAVAKKSGIKSKTPMFTIGSGKATITKAGTVKFTVKFKKAYASKLKKQKKLVVSFRGVIVTPSGDKLALAKNITIVK